MELIKHLLENGVIIDCVIGKAYTSDPKIVKEIEALGVRVVKMNYSLADKGHILQHILLGALKRARNKGQKVVINEVGGYFASILSEIPRDLKGYFGGVVETTTFGWNRYKRLEGSIPFPIYHVARSPLKEAEASHVGKAISLAFDHLMRRLGISISGRTALVVGYGMVGKQIAKSLSNHQLHVTVKDINPIQRLQAYIDGYRILETENLNEFDLIISATGREGISLDMIRKCKSGVILASGGSRDTEIDVRGLKRYRTKEAIHDDISIYHVEGKKIFVLRNGTALNFGVKSVPSEIVDLVYSEIICCISKLAQDGSKSGLQELDQIERAQIAEQWLMDMKGMNRIGNDESCTISSTSGIKRCKNCKTTGNTQGLINSSTSSFGQPN